MVACTDTVLTAYTFENYNRNAETVTTNNVVTKSQIYHYDVTDWLIKIEDKTDQDATKHFTIDYAYDDNCNTISKTNSSLITEDISYTYDTRQQLVQVERGPPNNTTILGQYDYNAAGLRIRHRNSERGNVDYYYDGPAVLEERNADNDSLMAHYWYADRLLSLDDGSNLQYYHHDALGSTVNLTNQDGSTRVSYWIDPYGQIRKQEGASVNRQVFTGQEIDENTGLIYFGARYYDPDTARFITQDSYLGENSTPPSLHRYLYAYSNPTYYTDPDGHDVAVNIPDRIESGGRVYFGEKRTYWGVQSSVADMDPELHEIGRPGVDDNGEPVVYLSEEYGGATVPKFILDHWARQFWDREHSFGIDGNDVVVKNISGCSYNEQRRAIRSYLKRRTGKAGPTIGPDYQKTILEELDPIDSTVDEYYAVKSGLKKPIDAAGDAAFNILLTYLGEEGVAQFAERVSPTVIRYLEKKFGKKAVQTLEEVVEEGVETTKSAGRLNTVGRTPGKKSATGRKVIERMSQEGKIYDDPLLGQMFKDSKGVWQEMKYGDMSHKVDAVSWWNLTGRYYGAKAPEVRSWMLDPDNYVIDYYKINRSAGGKLKEIYLPPYKNN